MIFENNRNRMVASVVKGKTFVDIGALWETKYEKVSLAYQNGASSVAILDQFPLNSKWWKLMRDRLNFPYEEISINLLNYNGTFDVTYCSGVIYHSQSPLHALQKLHSMTNETLILATVYVENIIESDVGKIELPSSGMLFLPALSPKDFEIIKQAIGYCRNKDIFGITKYAQAELWSCNDWLWWWLFTLDSIEAMIKVVGFKIEQRIIEERNNVVYKLKKLPSEI